MTSQAIAVRDQIMPAPVEQTSKAMQLHQDQLGVIVADSDWQPFVTSKGEPRRFLKRSGWRKIAFWYTLDLTIQALELDRDDRGKVIRAHAIARATHPNGRFADGDGGCSADERPMSKPEHDIAATAITRAKNRAISDLVGMGDLSAEELNGGGDSDDGLTPAALAPLSQQQQQQLAADLQASWPNIAGHAFTRMISQVLTQEFGTTGLPAIADRTLRGFIWWAQQPEGTGSLRAQDGEPAVTPAAGQRRDVPPTT